MYLPRKFETFMEIPLYGSSIHFHYFTLQFQSMTTQIKINESTHSIIHSHEPSCIMAVFGVRSRLTCMRYLLVKLSLLLILFFRPSTFLPIICFFWGKTSEETLFPLLHCPTFLTQSSIFSAQVIPEWTDSNPRQDCIAIPLKMESTAPL